jgi:hypothetical protein
MGRNDSLPALNEGEREARTQKWLEKKREKNTTALRIQGPAIKPAPLHYIHA